MRLLLIRKGLPRPVTQIPIRDAKGKVFRRIDMGWRQYGVGVEYDGEHHWTDPAAHAEDITRLEFLAARGWIVIRVSARHLRDAPDDILRRARNALRVRSAIRRQPAASSRPSHRNPVAARTC